MSTDMKIDNKKLIIGFTCSAFDLCHAGHIAMLREAKTVCNYLIVGLQNDPTLDRPTKNKPIQSITERYLQLAACIYVDEIIPYNTEKDLEDLLAILPINVRILGIEYQEKNFTGRDICNNRNIKLYFNERSHNFSTTELRKRISEAENAKKENIQ